MTVRDSSDRHSWENRIQLHKQPRDQAARDTDTLFACGGTVFPAPDRERYLTLHAFSFPSFITLESWILHFPDLPAMPLECLGEVLASGSVPGQTPAWSEGGRDSGRILLKYVQRTL